MLKTIREIEAKITRAFENDWQHAVCGTSSAAWPLQVSLGSVTKAELEADFAGMRSRMADVGTWAVARGLPVQTTNRRVSSSTQRVPTHVVVHDIDEAARVLGRPYIERLEAGRLQAVRLRELFGEAADVPGVVRMLHDNACDEADFDLVCKAASWFACNDATGLTTRQVPLEGFHAKWLDGKGRKEMIRLLCSTADLNLSKRPQQINFTYLYPTYLRKSLRRHDSHVQGDSGEPAYRPSTVMISENRDTALWFPEIAQGIAIQGDGWKGQALIGQLDWVAGAEAVVYWGDMDAVGFEILNAYRAQGLDARSIFMDKETFERYERFGTRVGTEGKTIKSIRKRLDFLTDSERELYECLTDPSWKRALRVEQERIPLLEAQRKVRGIAGAGRL